ncbi:MAG: hypothetical protein HY824_14890 [Acidobacteria bacterium]|nr:hypothetical protein [Acidobacteriota bacterium]
MHPFVAFLVGAGAGLAISILDYAALANVPKRERRVSFSDPAYLCKFFGHPVIGGFLAAIVAPSRPAMTALEAGFVGAAAPMLWRVIVRSAVAIARANLKDLSEMDKAE